MDPITRKEMYLAAAAGQDVALPVPVTREEMFLAKMAGQDVSVPDPITRMEMFLNAAAENAGGGAGGGGVKVTTGTFTPAEYIAVGSDFSYAIEHGLGEIPQYFFLFHDEMYDSLGGSQDNNCLYMYMCNPTGYYYKSIIGTSSMDSAKVKGTWKTPLATSDVVYIAGYNNADTRLRANMKHRWFAIGGVV